MLCQVTHILVHLSLMTQLTQFATRIFLPDTKSCTVWVGMHVEAFLLTYNIDWPCQSVRCWMSGTRGWSDGQQTDSIHPATCPVSFAVNVWLLK